MATRENLLYSMATNLANANGGSAEDARDTINAFFWDLI